MRFGIVLVLMVIWGGAGCGRSSPERGGEAVGVDAPVMCDCELSSWIVAGRGRHLYLTIDCPAGYEELDGVVEFTDERARDDYVERRDGSGALVAPRVSSKSHDWALRPFVADPDERVEASWRITVSQARALEADRVWATPYILIGTNSNSGMAAVLREAGLELPERVRRGGGVFGAFPGIDQPLGALVEPGSSTPD